MDIIALPAHEEGDSIVQAGLYAASLNSLTKAKTREGEKATKVLWNLKYGVPRGLNREGGATVRGEVQRAL